jgi:hypothetical protein
MAAPPPAENPMFMELMRMAAPVLIKRLLEPEIGTRDIIALLQRPERSELDMMKSAVDFLRSVQGTEKKESLVEEMTKMQQIKQLAAELVDGGGGGGAANANFWDAVASLFSNKDFAGSLGKMIGSDIQQRRAPGGAPAPTLQAPRPAGALPQQTVVHNPVPITVAQPPSQPPPQEQPPVGTRTIVGDKLVIVGAGGKRVVFPGNMPTLCEHLAAASQPEDLIQRTTSILYQLRDHEAWKPFVDAVLEETLKNDKENALKALRGWLGMLVQFSLLPIEAAKATLAAFEEHWVSFYTVLAQVMQVQVPQAPAVPADTAPAVPADTAPAPADGEGEEDEDEDEAGDENE